MTGPPIRVAVIGIGFGQAVHVPAFRSVPGFQVVGVAGSDLDRGRRVAERLGLSRAFDGWQDAVASTELEAVTIAVPPDLQPEIVEAAAGMRKHVFCEKPLAVSGVQAQRTVSAVLAAGVRHAIDLEFPELPAWRAIRETVHNGSLGAIREIRIDWRLARNPRRSARSLWKDDAARGGGVLGGFLCHALYHVEWLAGRFSELEAGRMSSAGEATWTATVSGVLEGGARADIRIDAAAPEGTMAHLLTIVGTSGTATLRNVGGQHGGPFELTVGGAVPQHLVEHARRGEDSRVAPVSALASRFAAAIRDDGEMKPDLTDGLRVQRLLDAVERSMTSGRAMAP